MYSAEEIRAERPPGPQTISFAPGMLGLINQAVVDGVKRKFEAVGHP